MFGPCRQSPMAEQLRGSTAMHAFTHWILSEEVLKASPTFTSPTVSC